MSVLIAVGLLINRMRNLEYIRRDLASQIEQRKVYAEKVNTQFEKMVTIKHYYDKIYQSAVPMAGLRQYYERYVTPIHKDLMENTGQLSGIKNELIRNLIAITTGQGSTLENLTLDIDYLGRNKDSRKRRIRCV